MNVLGRRRIFCIIMSALDNTLYRNLRCNGKLAMYDFCNGINSNLTFHWFRYQLWNIDLG